MFCIVSKNRQSSACCQAIRRNLIANDGGQTFAAAPSSASLLLGGARVPLHTTLNHHKTPHSPPIIHIVQATSFPSRSYSSSQSNRSPEQQCTHSFFSLAMAQQDSVDAANIQPPLTKPSFLALPDIAHACVASFLPDGNKKAKDSRLRVAEASRVLLEPYGGSLTRLSLKHNDSSAARLAALLRRQKMLAEVVVSEQGAIPALCQAIVQGCCRGVEKLDLPCFNGVGRNDHTNLLAGALEVEETLPALTTLWCCQMPGVLPKLTKALMGGAIIEAYSYWLGRTRRQRHGFHLRHATGASSTMQ